MTPEIKAKLDELPDSPGVYLMKNAKGKVFYIGKAKSLRARVRSYFSGSDTRAFVAFLDRLLADLEVILTSNEKEAMLVENDLIKEHQPYFNVDLRDDKRFLCLRLDLKKTYPRLEVTRRFAKDGRRYFGPYHSATSIRETLRTINRHFQLRTCSDQMMNTRTRPCLQYQIKRCPAPCVYDLSDGSYGENVDAVIQFLEGRGDDLAKRLRERMRQAADALNFERAAQLRDQVRAIERSLERQRMVTSDFVNRDVVGLYREGPNIEIHVMRTRDGRLIDAKRFSLVELEQPSGEVLADFAVRYYLEEPDAPEEILFPDTMEWGDTLAELLTERRQRKVAVLLPKRGDKRRLVDLATQNAEQAFRDKQRETGAAKSAVEKLHRSLHLRRQPDRIECFDISHFQGGQIVGSAVRFERGMPQKDLYRLYRVRSTDGQQDDFKSLYEVIARRARRGLEEGDLPDLMVIDGGKGQLAAARAALNDHGVDEVELISLAKARTQDERRGRSGPSVAREVSRSSERVFVDGLQSPIVLRQNSAELFLLARVRDEAHRFAITYQRRLQRKASSRTALDDISGVGPKRRKALLQAFGSVARIRDADHAALSKVVGEKTAIAIRHALKSDQAANKEHTS